MNEKINFQDLSALLSEKAAITKKDAETFLRDYFEIMVEELLQSGILKIKDLGTFKLMPVEDRESIDVTTGEKVLIPAHYKVAFTPDKKLAEAVNEPFAFFETIELEEGFESDELELLTEDDDSKESEQEPELIAEEEEVIFFKKEPAMDERKEAIFENSLLFEEKNDAFFEPKPVVEEKEEVYFEEEPTVEEGYFDEEPAYSEEETETYSGEEPVVEKEEKSYSNDEYPIEKEEEAYTEKKPVVEEEIFLGGEPIVDAGKIFLGKELISKEESKENMADSEDDRAIDDELLSEEPGDEGDLPPNWKTKSFCLNCHDYKAHITYRKKFFKIRQSLIQLQIIIGILSVLLAGALGYILYLTQFKNQVPPKVSSVAVVIDSAGTKEASAPLLKKEITPAPEVTVAPVSNTDVDPTIKADTVKAAVSEQKKDTVDRIAAEPSTAKVVAEKQPEKSETTAQKPTAKSSEKFKQVTIASGQRLTTISLAEYGSKVFWVYIYLENKSIISNPEVLPVGIKLSVPPASKYSIDSNNQASVQRARELAAKILKNFYAD